MRTIENYVNGTAGETETDIDRITEFDFDSAGRMTVLRAKNPKGSGAGVEDQETKYVYGATLSESGVARNDLLRAVIYPDSDDTTALGNGADSTYDRVEYTYDRVGRPLTAKDQRTIVHLYAYDPAGRMKADQVVNATGSYPAWPNGVDAYVKSITRAYDDRGRLLKITSHGDVTENPDDDSDIRNQVFYEYNVLGGVVKSWQSHSGAVVPSGGSESPKVQYAWERWRGLRPGKIRPAGQGHLSGCLPERPRGILQL